MQPRKNQLEIDLASVDEFPAARFGSHEMDISSFWKRE
jgi:hypothetical protein